MKPVLKKTLIHCGIILFFFLVAAVYMSPSFDGKVIQQGDTLKWQAMAKEQIDFHEKTGEHTLWNSSMFSGMPGYQITMGVKLHSLFSNVKNFLNLKFLGLSGDVGVIFLYLIGFYVCLYRYQSVAQSIRRLGFWIGQLQHHNHRSRTHD